MWSTNMAAWALLGEEVKGSLRAGEAETLTASLTCLFNKEEEQAMRDYFLRNHQNWIQHTHTHTHTHDIRTHTLILGWVATLTKLSQDYRGGSLFQAPCDYYWSVQCIVTQPYQAGHGRRMDVIKDPEELLCRYHSLEIN